ncbi:hypothetical protein EXIGLDRAFT_847449 [Exidia glandulosa HHB12029]|uniref:Uncharacterized protein n=1 Tax=Exidia glandulosa HHB12029 TaxID=1314781 RepID=A0A166MXQ0_EXIGL|nr:hypothetical protein EXIGLDRAFT_847449 [Exidia glandulosa HHB12029]
MIKSDPEVFDDPNRPPSRPASALSDSGDSSDLGNLSDADDANWSGDEFGPPDEWISKRVARNIMRRDGFCCLVCGTAQRKNLLVLRLTAQHMGNFVTPQMTWLQTHKLLPAVYEGRNQRCGKHDDPLQSATRMRMPTNAAYGVLPRMTTGGEVRASRRRL